MNDTPAVIVSIQAPAWCQRLIQVVNRVKALLPVLQNSLPAAIQTSVLTDRTVTIRASVQDARIRADAHRGAGRDGDFRFPETETSPPPSHS